MTTTATEMTDDLATADDAIFEAPAVLRIIWADPQHMAEHLALWSLARFGPRADKAVEKLRGGSVMPRDELEGLVIRRQTRVAMTEGAFVGGPFIVLIPIAFCAALLAQGQMVFELAAVGGHEPNDRMRAAELLVLIGAYESTDAAAAALATVTQQSGRREGKRLPRGTRWTMIKRMAYLVGVLGIAEQRSRLRVALGWTGIGVLFLVGLVLPLVWVPYMAYSTRRSTLRLGERTRAYYAAADAGEAGVTVQRRTSVRVGGTAALVRTTFFVVVPIGAAVVALLTDFSVTGGHWVTAGLLLLVVSAVATLTWFGYRWWRRRR
jgi:hypothetical protein